MFLISSIYSVLLTDTLSYELFNSDKDDKIIYLLGKLLEILSYFSVTVYDAQFPINLHTLYIS